MMRGRRPKSVIAAVDASHFRAGRAADDAILRGVDDSLRRGVDDSLRRGWRPAPPVSPALQHSKIAIHVPPRTAHRRKHPVHLVCFMTLSRRSTVSFHLFRSLRIQPWDFFKNLFYHIHSPGFYGHSLAASTVSFASSSASVFVSSLVSH